MAGLAPQVQRARVTAPHRRQVALSGHVEAELAVVDLRVLQAPRGSGLVGLQPPVEQHVVRVAEVPGITEVLGGVVGRGHRGRRTAHRGGHGGHGGHDRRGG